MMQHLLNLLVCGSLCLAAVTPRGAPQFALTDSVGYDGEVMFNDMNFITQAVKVTSVVIQGGDRVNGITFRLDTGRIMKHGGNGGHSNELPLVNGDYIEKAEVCEGKGGKSTLRVVYAKLTTKKGFTVENGKKNDRCKEFVADPGYAYVGAFGREGGEMDKLGFVGASCA